MIDLVSNIEERGIFDTGEYMVIHTDLEAYNKDKHMRYFQREYLPEEGGASLGRSDQKPQGHGESGCERSLRMVHFVEICKAQASSNKNVSTPFCSLGRGFCSLEQRTRAPEYDMCLGNCSEKSD